jgi:AraC-like DNA-binding protein
MNPNVALGAVGLALALPAAALSLFAPRSGGTGRRFLALVFAEAGAYFAGELISASGPSALSLALGYSGSLWCLPAMYLYASPSARGGARLRHFIPALVNAPLGIAAALLCAARGFKGEPWLLAYTAVLLGAQTAQLLAYGRRLALGAALEPWPARIVLSSLAAYAAFVVLTWISFIWDAVGSGPPPFAAIDLSLAVVALLVVWTLGLCVLWGEGAARSAAEKKYGGRELDRSEAAALVARARELLEAEEDLASPEVEPRRLAARLGVPYYLLSRAVNEGEGMTLGDFVNASRIERAKRLLLEDPGAGILDIALESGFSAKSTFNEVFKRMEGRSPTEFRARGAARSAATR